MNAAGTTPTVSRASMPHGTSPRHAQLLHPDGSELHQLPVATSTPCGCTFDDPARVGAATRTHLQTGARSRLSRFASVGWASTSCKSTIRAYGGFSPMTPTAMRTPAGDVSPLVPGTGTEGAPSKFAAPIQVRTRLYLPRRNTGVRSGRAFSVQRLASGAPTPTADCSLDAGASARGQGSSPGTGEVHSLDGYGPPRVVGDAPDGRDIPPGGSGTMSHDRGPRRGHAGEVGRARRPHS
jgi:hypothetical protein